MKRMRAVFCAALLLGIASAVSAQTRTKTVTNADLEKFRQKRVAAQKELEENYKELGFASPEERERRYEESRRESARIIAELRRDEQLRERRLAAHQTYYPPRAQFSYPNPNFIDYGGRYAPSYLYYQYYSPGYVHRRSYDRRRAPRRFRTLRRMIRRATRGSVPGRRPGRH